jgi:hypothetical protein
MDEIAIQLSSVTQDIFEISYEECITSPDSSLHRLAAFCALAPSPEQYRDAKAMLHADTVFNYKKDPILQQFAITHQSRLKFYNP